MKNLRLLCLLLFIKSLPACDDAGATDTTDTATNTTDTLDITADTTPPLLVPEVVQIDWQVLGEVDINFEGQSALFEAAIPANARYVALRVIPLGEEIGGVCSRLEDVSLGSGEVLVGPTEEQAAEAVCTVCRAPVSWANGASVFVLGQGASALPTDADVLRLKIQLRDCSLGVRATRNRFPALPTRARVEMASEQFNNTHTPPDVPYILSVRMAYGAASGANPVANDPHMAEVWRVASERFAAAGITLRLEAEAYLTSDDGRVVYGPSMPEPLNALQMEARGLLSLGAGDVRFVPVLWVGCLLQDDSLTGARNYPVAQTTRIPGSLGDGVTPSLILMATGTCDPTVTPTRDAEFEGLVLAHELGHYLGLYHADTAPGALLPAGDDEQIMRSGFAQTMTPAQAWFSPAQIAAMRRHPDLH